MAAVDEANLRRRLTRVKRVGSSLMSTTEPPYLGRFKKEDPLPPGKTNPLHLRIPRAWKYFDDGVSPFVLYDSGRTADRVILMSSRRMMTVQGIRPRGTLSHSPTHSLIQPHRSWRRARSLRSTARFAANRARSGVKSGAFTSAWRGDSCWPRVPSTGGPLPSPTSPSFNRSPTGSG